MKRLHMVISSLNIKLLEDRLGFINKAIAKLRLLSQLPEDRFLEGDTPAAAESYLRRCLEAVFDIGRHIVARTVGKAEVEYEVAVRLAESGVLTRELAGQLRLMAGYRNRLVHFYNEVSEKELFHILQNNLSDIERFVREITAFIQSYRRASSSE